MEQLSLFSATEYKNLNNQKPVMDAEFLQQWKSRVLTYQQRIRNTEAPQQVSLFDLAASHCDPERIDPFKLYLQSMAFYRMPDNYGQAAIYFVIDSDAEILLYIGETSQSNKRWKNTHDCKEYIGSYQELNHRYEIKTAVNIGFWWDAPVERKPRQALEQALIQKWKSPFNKEMWELWGQPFKS
ncbi:GIY-YIG nuclease family protein [Cronbergia sp. UHCC 0137]|uniref:GIY-YIG nuclease family protein n=1 Tax=Cronbergia sp. UHCC 0137 TaxID=3110239 RepID=UPI002B21A855|nr:GIY-YIG nuclease family protein [Cronbergia sp. UHCC 0137]MEA5621186.1 GIY-YIG nuclease family protein [Cronbergia sp. UHCC 0137]